MCCYGDYTYMYLVGCCFQEKFIPLLTFQKRTTTQGLMFMSWPFRFALPQFATSVCRGKTCLHEVVNFLQLYLKKEADIAETLWK